MHAMRRTLLRLRARSASNQPVGQRVLPTSQRTRAARHFDVAGAGGVEGGVTREGDGVALLQTAAAAATMAIQRPMTIAWTLRWKGAVHECACAWGHDPLQSSRRP